MIIAVDFDGTLVVHEYPRIGDDIPNAFRALGVLKGAGHKLVLWTCRGGVELVQAVTYCRLRGIIFDAVNENVPGLGFNPHPKIYADLYIDDRALLFGQKLDWDSLTNWVLTHGQEEF